MNATEPCVCLDAADCHYLQNQNLTCVQLSQLYEYWDCDCCTVAVACNKTDNEYSSVGLETNDYLYVGLSTAFCVGIIACLVFAHWYGDHFNSDNDVE
jgi:hypothetical protein